MTLELRRRHLLLTSMAGGYGGAQSPFSQVQALFSGGSVNGGLYDISNLATLYEDRSLTPSTPASVDGLVGTVLDLSGNGNHRVAPSSSARARLRQSGSFYYLEYDAIDDCYQVAGFEISNRFYVGGSMRGSPSGSFFIEQSPNAGSNNGFFFSGTSGSPWHVRRSGNHSAAGELNWEGTTDFVWDCVYRTSNQNYYRNAVERANNSITGSQASQSNATNTLNIMSRNGANFFSGTFEYGLVLLDGDRLDAEITLMRSWLASLNGVTL